MIIFSSNVAGFDGRDRSSFSDLAKQFVAVHFPRTVWHGNTQTYAHIPLSVHVSPPPHPQDCGVATGTYKALCGIVHEAQLEALLVLKGLCQGMTQVVRGQGSLPTVLELGENTLKRTTRTWLHADNGAFCLLKVLLLGAQSGHVTQTVSHVHDNKREPELKHTSDCILPLMHKRCMTLPDRSVRVAASSCVWRCPAAKVPTQVKEEEVSLYHYTRKINTDLDIS